MKIENGEWILTPSELAACFKETGNTPGGNFSEGNNQAASRLILTQTYHAKIYKN